MKKAKSQAFYQSLGMFEHKNFFPMLTTKKNPKKFWRQKSISPSTRQQ